MTKQILNIAIGFTYRNFAKPIFFLFDPENIHDFVSSIGSFLGKFWVLKKITSWFLNFKHRALEQNVLGIQFLNPIGLSAGFDKDAKLMSILPSVGFGYEEIGSFTALPYQGNVKPRLYRLPEQQSLRVNYGLKNLGAVELYNKLAGQKWEFPVGISIAKTNAPETSQVSVGVEDYFFTYKTFKDIGDYFTINISCPNTCEEKPIFAEPENLQLLLNKIFSITKSKPIFIKLSPDLTDEQLFKILEVCKSFSIDGFVCSNLTKKNAVGHLGKGGFSGKLMDELANNLIAKVYKYFNGTKLIIGAGGIFSADDAYKKIKAGATLLQLITGMVFQGPQLINEINIGLVKLLAKDGYRNISEAIGKGEINEN